MHFEMLVSYLFVFGEDIELLLNSCILFIMYFDILAIYFEFLIIYFESLIIYFEFLVIYCEYILCVFL
jgi:hypothetical protein